MYQSRVKPNNLFQKFADGLHSHKSHATRLPNLKKIYLMKREAIKVRCNTDVMNESPLLSLEETFIRNTRNENPETVEEPKKTAIKDIRSIKCWGRGGRQQKQEEALRVSEFCDSNIKDKRVSKSESMRPERRHRTVMKRHESKLCGDISSLSIFQNKKINFYPRKDSPEKGHPKKLAAEPTAQLQENEVSDNPEDRCSILILDRSQWKRTDTDKILRNKALLKQASEHSWILKSKRASMFARMA